MGAICSTLNIYVLLLILFFRVSFTVHHHSLRPLESISDGDGSSLVSSDGSFELGFFSPGNSMNRYLGIWYKKIPVQTVIWVANRCNPINDMSGLLTLNSSTGNLVLFGHGKIVVWSTSLSKQLRKPVVELLDSGNLVVRDEEETNDNNPETTSNYLWESFDYPTDTLLPEMKFGWDTKKGINRKLSAWKNAEDPCSSDFTIEIKQLEVQIRQGNSIYFRTGPWNGFGFTSPDLKPNPLFDFRYVYNASYQLYYMYNLKNSSVISRLVHNRTTSTYQRYSWNIGADQSWKLYASTPRDYCDNYGRCGTNGNCVISESPVCQCLKGFKPRSQEEWSLRDWSHGCVRNSPLNCEDKDHKDKVKDGFFKLDGLKMPDTRNSWFNDSMNLKECRAKCLRNCSCMAYANTDSRGEGSGCRLWYGDLIDIRQIPGGGQDLYIREPASESAKADREQAVIVTSVIGFVSGIFSVGYYIGRRAFKEKTKKSKRLSLMNGGQEEDLELPFFDLSTITTATNGFSANNKLGEGGFGPVYKGKLEDGQEIAVKRHAMNSGQGLDEFKNEIVLIAKLQHRNLVKLLGCCIQGEEKLLVYEYMPNNSLDCFIFDQVRVKLLDWPIRFQIICGIARGLLYLHEDSRLRVIHRDLKPSNILLDNEMNPKISDFGIAKTFGGDQVEGNTKRVLGTYGYMAPEYAFKGLFSIKSDIFSFGIVTLEIVSGKKSTVFGPQNDSLTLAQFAWKLMKEGRETELVDECLRDSCIHLEEVLRCIHVGLLCVQQRAADRPNMSSVLLMLSSETALPQPKKPAYFIERGPQQQCPQLSWTNDLTMTVLEAR